MSKIVGIQKCHLHVLISREKNCIGRIRIEISPLQKQKISIIYGLRLFIGSGSRIRT